MTTKLYREDAYRVEASATVIGHSPEGGIILDQSLFYPQGGGQPGDSGRLIWDGGSVPIATAVQGEADAIVLLSGAPENVPEIGQELTQKLDWSRRLGHMRIHTALHLLSVVVPLPVSGGAITAEKGRLDFDMPEAAVDKEQLEDELNSLIARDLPVDESWITDAQLRADPGLVKTMSVAPPIGQGRIRLISIGTGDEQIDLQPCGGTHVARTSEIGTIRIGKVQKKGRQNRRIYLHLEA